MCDNTIGPTMKRNVSPDDIQQERQMCPVCYRWVLGNVVTHCECLEGMCEWTVEADCLSVTTEILGSIWSTQ